MLLLVLWQWLVTGLAAVAAAAAVAAVEAPHTTNNNNDDDNNNNKGYSSIFYLTLPYTRNNTKYQKAE